MYQYLYYTSNHPQKTFKAVIKGECIRYIRTNTSYETYAAMTHCFKKRLLKRNYPSVLIDKTFASVKYSNRPRYLQCCQPKLQAPTPPVYKILPPPQYSLLKKIVLHEYRNLHFMSPRFIALKHSTLHNKLVRSHIELTDDQLIDVSLLLNDPPSNPSQPATLPHLRSSSIGISRCKHPRCITCKLHLDLSRTFKSNYPLNRTTYRIRHSYSCKSTNIVYLITCTK